MGKIEFDNDKIDLEDPNLRNLIAEVSIKVKMLMLRFFC